jgi:hypothetical protein
MKKPAIPMGLATLLIALMALMICLPGCNGNTDTQGGYTMWGGNTDTPGTPNPVISSVSKRLTAGQECVITGYNFGSTRSLKDDKMSYVEFVGPDGAMRSTVYNSWTDVQIKCVVPNVNPSKDYMVVVYMVNPTGVFSSSVIPSATNTISVLAKVPVITRIKPSAINANDATPITVMGTDFGPTQGTGYVRFGEEIGGTPQRTVTSWSANQVVCTVPTTVSAGANIPVYLITNDTYTSNSMPFTVAAAGAPIITTITPDSVATNTTPVITITGNNLGTTGTVTFTMTGSNPITVATGLTWSATSIVCTMPVEATKTPGTLNVTATTAAGTTNSSPITVGGSGKVYALFVGINAYAPPSELTYCVADANDMKANLSASSAWQGAEITTLLDAAATKKGITDAITSLGAKTSSGDTFFFYYSGHGSGDTSLAYICPVDSTTASSMISDVEMQNLLQPIKAKKCIIFDSCHSGGFVGKHPGFKTRYMPIQGQQPRAFTGGGFSKQLQSLSDLVFIGACKGSQESAENSELKHGFFTYYALEGLGAGTTIGPASEGGTFITAQQVYKYSGPKAAAYNPSQDAVIQDNYTQGLTIKQ